ncbi:CaiB/BaiF CoA transferase family protein [Pseudonocardia broussonetiae]|uniref:CoA transferase n=1 Tax=Pseudonocardia broussonetiae TaxID=2736640 RepID=A0A6M6JRV5_9PSEU|nr:CoA transferase [Pseudonocardia broussonetiae]QJY49963.1 CoA transferase [Pseudonocardia broussonetiae]
MGEPDDDRPGPLAGALVLDLSRALAGPHAAMLMGDLGARVIKVEIPGGGDESRGWGPPFVGDDDDRVATYFLAANRNKESVALDLKDPADRAVLDDLVADADVLVENFRPGVLERLGLGPDVLLARNPGLVVLSITGFGHDGPDAHRPGYDQIAQGETGLMSLTGSGPDDPQRIGVPICDLTAGVNGATGVLAALLERTRTGRGQVVRTSLLAAGVGLHAFQGTRWTVGAELGRATGNHHPTIAPYGLFACKDGSVQIAAANEALWRRLAGAFALPQDDPRFATNADRVAHRADLTRVIERAFADRTAAELLADLDRLGVPTGAVRTLDEVYAWEQVASQRLVVRVDHPTAGPIRLPGPVLRFFDADGTERTRTRHTAPPLLDQDRRAIRSRAEGGGG